jgi:hypothetical protein
VLIFLLLFFLQNGVETHPGDYDQRIASMTKRIHMLEKENQV